MSDLIDERAPKNSAPWPRTVSHAMRHDPRFDAIWDIIKTWDIAVPEVYSGYCGATGSHVAAILGAIDANADWTSEAKMAESIETSPKDGTEVYLELQTKWVKAYWDDKLKTWVLSYPFHLETMKRPDRWQPVPRADPPTYGL
jgi:hypothetical protein